jgi:hypothetical protein
MQGDRITAPGLSEEKFEKIVGCLLEEIPASFVCCGSSTISSWRTDHEA